jgi:hypothetical protein
VDKALHGTVLGSISSHDLTTVAIVADRCIPFDRLERIFARPVVKEANVVSYLITIPIE